MAAGFTINGTSRLRSTLRKAGADLTGLKPANREAAEIAMEAARDRTPVRTGRLRATLRVGATNRAGVIRAGNNRATNGVPYAGPRHWGWPARNLKPYPFMLLGARDSEAQWRDVYEKYAERVLRNVKGA